MKRGTLNFLGRKNQSLFDTNIKMKDMVESNNVELVLESSAIPESGTASVRARPTVKHHASTSLESFQGFAVPTPKVPLLPLANGPKLNGSVSGDSLSNGSVISLPDLVEGEIFIPPPPSMAPPPPPGTFIPPPDFMGDLNSLSAEEDLTLLKPPPMAPPKPPSTCSSGSGSSIRISGEQPDHIPEHPRFAPPQPPPDRQQKTSKTPPPKPIRLSSISITDSPPQTPAPPPPVQTPTLSTFNPQHTAKLYNVPKTSILGGYEESKARPKQVLVLEDSGSIHPTPVSVQADGKTAPASAASTPDSTKEPTETLQVRKPPPSPVPEPLKETKTAAVPARPEAEKPPATAPQTPPQLQKVINPVVNPEPSSKDPRASTSLTHNSGKFSPILDRKLRNLKNNETSGSQREGAVTSPLALLKAAKERERQRTTNSLSRENSAKKVEPLSASIQPSDTSPNSFIVTPRSSSSLSQTSQDDTPERPKLEAIQTPPKPSSPAPVKALRPLSQVVTDSDVRGQNGEKSDPKPQPAQEDVSTQELNMPLLPPPPEFDDLEEFMEPPPSVPAPDPPKKAEPALTVTPIPPVQIVTPIPPAPSVTPTPPAPSVTPTPPAPSVTSIPPAPSMIPTPPAPSVSPLPPAHIPPPPPKPKTPTLPRVPPPDTTVKPKPQVQVKPKVAAPQQPLSPSQATLLSILQRKMLEMDHKMGPAKEAEAGSDDWGSPQCDDENKVPVVPKVAPQSRFSAAVHKAASLDMRELEGKVIRKYQEANSTKSPTSNGPSKQQYGMTFTVRPGTKQPITLVNKEQP